MDAFTRRMLGVGMRTCSGHPANGPAPAIGGNTRESRLHQASFLQYGAWVIRGNGRLPLITDHRLACRLWR